MTTFRSSLHFALVLSLVSLTCGIGAACAEMGETCCCMTADGGSPCTEMSGGNDAPADPKPAAAASSERYSVAIVASSPLASSLGASTSSPQRHAAVPAHAASTPLYLSHCAFLC